MNESLSDKIKEIYGTDVTIKEKSPIYGGDIIESFMVTLSNGERFFLKENSGKPADFFTAEAEGLRAIEATGTIDCAHVIGTGSYGRTSYLLLEVVETGYKKPGFWDDFGRRLAAMHRADTSSFLGGRKQPVTVYDAVDSATMNGEGQPDFSNQTDMTVSASAGRFGFCIDNFIGATRQINDPRDTWIDFYRTNRLEYQFKLAWEYFDNSDRATIHGLLDGLDRWLIEPEHPSLLHGDLWGGNFMTGSNGEPVLIDPAVYVGHAEADIAMTELFGGFAPEFYDSYRSAFPFEPGYADRRDLYNLYHLLNHLNLFGGSYLGGVLRIVRRFG